MVLTKKRMSMKTLKNALLFFSMAILLSACAGNSSKDQDQGPTVLELTGSGSYFKSIFLTITEVAETDSNYLYTLKATHGNDTVGFSLALSKDIPAGVYEDGSVNQTDGFKTGTVKFIRSGVESDRFLQVLSSIWETTPKSTEFSSEPVSPLVFSSNLAPFDGSKPGTNSFKLFFDLNAMEPGELFLTHDTNYNRIELQEKDASFREVILNALGGKPTGVE